MNQIFSFTSVFVSTLTIVAIALERLAYNFVVVILIFCYIQLLEYVIPPPPVAAAAAPPSPKKTHVMVLARVMLLARVMVLARVIVLAVL